MRRWLVLLVALAVLAAHPVTSHAQYQLIGPGGVFNVATASVSVANSTTATTLYTYTTPAGWAVGPGSPGYPGQPLRLRLYCTLSTASSGQGVVNVGVSYGTTASVALANAVQFPISLSNAPMQITVEVRPTASYSGVNGAFVPYLWATLATQSSTNGSSVPGGASLVAQQLAYSADPTGQPALSVIWQWGTATSGNSVTCYNGTETIGN